MKTLLQQIGIKNQKDGFIIHPPAKQSDIERLENAVGFNLPEDFVEFYQICNGFECNDDIFNFSAIDDILTYEDYGENWFYFSEYMIYSDMWGLRKTKEGNFEIFNASFPQFTLTSSLESFLQRFLKGNVFEKEGLSNWLDEIMGNEN